MNGNKLWRARCTLVLVLLILGSAFTPARSAQAAALTVNSLSDADDGACNTTNCTLREAINAANSAPAADEIRFSVSGTINLGSILPTILSTGGALTIDGSSQSVKISGGEVDRILYIQSSAELTLLKLDLRNGYTTNSGGAIYNQGALTMQDCTLTGNSAMLNGGGIYNAGRLSLINTSFSSNSADTVNGGGLYIDRGTVSITGGAFQQNVANFSGGAIFNRYEGEYAGGDLTIEGTNFLLNNASGGNGGAIANESDLHVDQAFFALNGSEDSGGAIYNDAGGIFQITGSTFNYNSSVFLSGGALFANSVAGASSVKDSSFTHNEAHLDGGGFYVLYGTVIFERTRFAYNQSHRDGGGGFNSGGLVYLTSDSFESNAADQNGAGFYNKKNMRIRQSAFLHNEALGDGGGVYHAEGAMVVDVQTSTFYDNRAVQGGALFNRAELHVVNCTLSTNSAAAGGGGGVNGAYLTYLRNTILTNSTSGGNCASPSLLPANAGNNLDSGTTCHFASDHGSLSNTDPRLGALQDHGGGTQIMPLLPGSPAIDAVIHDAPNECPELDQRGYPRPFGAYCDIGAVEQYSRIFLPLVEGD